jgi:hypothetical protein
VHPTTYNAVLEEGKVPLLALEACANLDTAVDTNKVALVARRVAEGLCVLAVRVAGLAVLALAYKRAEIQKKV